MFDLESRSGMERDSLPSLPRIPSPPSAAPLIWIHVFLLRRQATERHCNSAECGSSSAENLHRQVQSARCYPTMGSHLE